MKKGDGCDQMFAFIKWLGEQEIEVVVVCCFVRGGHDDDV